MKINKLRKILSLLSIISLSIGGLLFIAYLLFELKDDIYGQIAWSLVTVFTASILSFNFLEGIQRKSFLGYSSAISIVVSSILVLVCIWLSYFGINDIDVLTKITIVIGAISIFETFVFKNIIRLSKKALVIQIIFAAILFAVELDLILIIFSSSIYFGIQWIVSLIIVDIVLYVILYFKGKLKKEDETITITLKEYNELKARIKELENK